MRSYVIALGMAGAVACAGAPASQAPAAKPASQPKLAPADSRADTVAPAAVPKSGAPVEVRGAVGESRARIEIAFAADARDVRVELRGTDGLVVQGSPVPVQGRSVSQGDTLSLDVAFVPGEAHSNLAVLVTGRFAGGVRSRAASFTVGDPPERPAKSEARDDGRGRSIKVAGEGEIRQR